MRTISLALLLVLGLCGKAHVSQVHLRPQSLQTILSRSRHVVIARHDAKGYQLEKVLESTEALKPGMRLHIEDPTTGLYRAIGETIAAGGPVPSPIVESYTPLNAPLADEPVILFLSIRKAESDTFFLSLTGAMESMKSLGAVEAAIKESKRKH
ncbi:MAG: hypothetical protein RL318_2874 [Fibrobacterota bacterium]|jgi:hypothetical protein